jgi:rubrerythrin
MTKENHCRDCCCAKSWEALGISSYTGKSIPEHITELRKLAEANVHDFAERTHEQHRPDGSAKRWTTVVCMVCDFEIEDDCPRKECPHCNDNSCGRCGGSPSCCTCLKPAENE